ncbi:hypothetical protein CPB85DRAFT_1353810, partial [Mucidula mucida]
MMRNRSPSNTGWTRQASNTSSPQRSMHGFSRSFATVYTAIYILSMYQIRTPLPTVFPCMIPHVIVISAHIAPETLAGTITLLWAILTMRVGCVWHFVNATFIDAAATREDEFVWMYGPRGPARVETFGSVTLFAMILVADLIM